jgi:hypothetical protein
MPALLILPISGKVMTFLHDLLDLLLTRALPFLDFL